MVKFLQSENGSMISDAQIVKVWESDADGRCWANLVDGSVVELSCTIEYFQNNVGDIFLPAYPGWQVAKIVWAETPFARVEPIVAWRVYDGLARPVVVSDILITSNPKAVLTPDGRVLDTEWERYHESLSDWVQDRIAFKKDEEDRARRRLSDSSPASTSPSSHQSL